MLSEQKSLPFFVILSIILFVLIGYYIERYETVPLFICYFLAFALYVVIIRNYHLLDKKQVAFLLVASLLFRVALVFSIPALSDDFYRFIWDGRLLAAGLSPFSDVPSFYMTPGHTVPGLDSELFDKLNSKERFSSYPPVCQLVFWISAALSPASIQGSVLIMKGILFIFELGTFWVMMKLMRCFEMNPAAILIYALNPLVIVEITGNLHFEGVMIFFLLTAIYVLKTRRLVLSSFALALAVDTKLIPLLFLPLFLRPLTWRNAVVLWGLTGAISLLLFIPLLDEGIISGFSSSLQYYFQHFEFNASIYYLIREAGYIVFGFNIIQFAGPLLATVATVLILIISFRKADGSSPEKLGPKFFTTMLWCLFIYFISTTTLHPWYIITLLAISVFSGHHFPILWTGLIFLTYSGYSEYSFHENYFLVALEYIILFAYILCETVWRKRKILF